MRTSILLVLAISVLSFSRCTKKNDPSERKYSTATLNQDLKEIHEFNNADSTSVKSIIGYLILTRLMQDTLTDKTYKELITLYGKSPLRIEIGQLGNRISTDSILNKIHDSVEQKNDSIDLSTYSSMIFVFDKASIPVKQLEKIFGEYPKDLIETEMQKASGTKVRYDVRCYNRPYCPSGFPCQPGHIICYYGSGGGAPNCYGPFIGECFPAPSPY